MISAQDALQRLREGNWRFVEELRFEPRMDRARRERLALGQAPFATILGCSDSRVPPELIFQLGLGELFVIRVAGNVVTPTQIGSIEFGVESLGTRLVVVLGHTQCGAVQATVAALENPSVSVSPGLRSIVDCIRPHVEAFPERDRRADPTAAIERGVRENIRASVNRLRRGSRLLEQLTRTGEVLIVGAEYSLETGVVDFFQGVK